MLNLPTALSAVRILDIGPDLGRLGFKSRPTTRSLRPQTIHKPLLFLSLLLPSISRTFLAFSACQPSPKCQAGSSRIPSPAEHSRWQRRLSKTASAASALSRGGGKALLNRRIQTAPGLPPRVFSLDIANPTR